MTKGDRQLASIKLQIKRARGAVQYAVNIAYPFADPLILKALDDAIVSLDEAMMRARDHGTVPPPKGETT